MRFRPFSLPIPFSIRWHRPLDLPQGTPHRAVAGAALAMALLAAAAAPARAGFVPGFEERTVRAEADAFDATATDADFEEDLAPDASPWLGGATAGVLVPSVGATSSAVQDSALATGSLDAALAAEAAAQVDAVEGPAFATAAAESYASWIFQVDATGGFLLEGHLAATALTAGDAFASLTLEEVGVGGPSVVLADLEASLDETIDFANAVDLEAGSVYRLTLFALAAVQMDALTLPSRGLATAEVTLAPVPEPGILALWAAALGLGRIRGTWGGPRRRAEAPPAAAADRPRKEAS